MTTRPCAALRPVDVVVVNWNAGSQLRVCLDSIDRYGGAEVARTIVVDNGSVDGSEEAADDRSGVTLVRTGANFGFGRACNVGARLATAQYLLFLNPDAALFADTAKQALSFMRDPASADVGICGVQLLDESGRVTRTCARFPSAWGLFAHAIGVDRLVPRLGHVMAEWDHGQTRQVDHVIGAFFLVRREVFDALHGFDERFFVYLEDLDFSYRARQAGWRSVYLAEARAFHAGGGTSKQVKAMRLFYSLRSRLLYVLKHFSTPGALLVMMATLFIEPWSRVIGAMAERSWVALIQTWEAYRLLWRWLARWAITGETR